MDNNCLISQLSNQLITQLTNFEPCTSLYSLLSLPTQINIGPKEDSKNNDLIFPELQGTSFRNEKKLEIRVKTVTRNFNRRLEIVAEKVSIDKKMTMHITRHSFGNISGDKIPIQMLQKLYRHSSITTTINYQQNFMHKETDEALDKVINF